jgi:leucyl/phenylalanyl-tRNA---protein transferase
MGQLTLLNPRTLSFPPIEQALDDPPGLLAIGGDLSPERLLAAYDQGIFPWYQDDEENSPILWWSPDPRMVLKPANVHVSTSLRKIIRKGSYRISMDTAFKHVISQCASLRAHREGTWITDEMQQAYITLHQLGHAHSVEVWDSELLVGGLYGVSLGRMFFGESMFSLQDNVSKIAFVALCRQLQAWDYVLIDCQLPTAHLRSLGAAAMPRSEFAEVLRCNRYQPKRAERWVYSAESLNC